VYQIQQTGPCQKPIRVDLAVFVNPDRCPRKEKRDRKYQDDDHTDDEDDKKKCCIVGDEYKKYWENSIVPFGTH